MLCYYEDADCNLPAFMQPPKTENDCVACQIVKLRETIDHQGPRYSKKQLEDMGI